MFELSKYRRASASRERKRLDREMQESQERLSKQANLTPAKTELNQFKRVDSHEYLSPERK